MKDGISNILKSVKLSNTAAKIGIAVNTKKNSKKIGKDYSKLDQFNCVGDVEYYGVLLRDGRTKIDTKRYKKFFKILIKY